MARTYRRDAKGRFAKAGSVNGTGGRISLIPGRIVLGRGTSVRGGGLSTPSTTPKKVTAAKGKAGSSKQPVINKINAPVRPIQQIETGKVISREAAAAIMFGSAGARKKLAAGKKARRK